jgi:hypothetical protein
MQVTYTDETHASFTFTPLEIRAHPKRFTDDMGDTYEGIRLIRDEAIPLNEIHFLNATHRMIMKGPPHV